MSENLWEQMQRMRQEFEPKVKAKGYEVGHMQWDWRVKPPEIVTLEDAELAVMDALVSQGGYYVWMGDGTSCVAQIVTAQARRADAWRKKAIELLEVLRQYAPAEADKHLVVSP